MQDFPRPEELVEAVAAYLFAELRPQVPKDQSFKVLVAANVCAVVARELRAGEGPSRMDAELFERLLGRETGSSDPEAETGGEHARARAAATELAAAIRAGDLDASLDQLLAELPEHVRRKLDVARPGYAD